MASDYYDILGVPPKADAGEIRKAYRVLAQKWHPDKNPGDPWATDRFMRLGEAYRVLMDPARRAAHDWLRAREGRGIAIPASPRRHSGQNAAPAPHRVSWQAPKTTHHRGRQHLRGREGRRLRPALSSTRKRKSRSQDFLPWLLSLKHLPQRFLHWLKSRPPAGLECEVVPTPHHPDLIMDLRMPKWLAVRGTRINFILTSQDQRRRLKLAIPPGVQEGPFMKVKGGGKTAGPVRGHLYINIRLKD